MLSLSYFYNKTNLGIILFWMLEKKQDFGFVHAHIFNISDYEHKSYYAIFLQCFYFS